MPYAVIANYNTMSHVKLFLHEAFFFLKGSVRLVEREVGVLGLEGGTVTNLEGGAKRPRMS